MNAIVVAIQQDRDRATTRKTINESRELRRELLERILHDAPNPGLRRQAQFYLDRLNAGRPTDGR